MMHAIGLTPSDTGEPGGKEIGQKVSHYIADSGPFARACVELIPGGFDPLYVELWSAGDERARKKKAESKTRYSCPSCDLNAWAKPQVALICGDCDELLEAEDAQ